MNVSVHLISVPTEEVVTSRVVYLPEPGGNFGRAPTCDICLPDQSKRISRLHGEVRLADHGYVIINSGKNQTQLNDKPMHKDREYPLNDGDIIKVENYTMLISTLVSSSSDRVEEPIKNIFAHPFELNLDDDETEFLEQSETQIEQQTSNSFSHKNILSDDPFSSDPFEELDSEMAQHVEIDEIDHQVFSPKSNLQYLHVDTPHNTLLEASIEKLLTISEKNQQYLQNPMMQHEALFDALEKTVDQFLNEFAPTTLESQFSEYISTVFSNKEKKFWNIYRKHFKHRRQNGDFHRQFKAMFMENMQKQREKDE
ncbi:FHA domain-containing protein [Vibrio mediterranei]|jgi:predicted component of type VI protein secretion system|uniref:FHA domain-containing protein n=1 Tax=Vibrio mediterranei TaxID=689 RepID=UPI001EFD29A6|nr:FHA domain-containing protein [Vibrio mediterranei]MCG9626262.1 FHA domain-containing protein [Vibrio mediterranei]